MNFLVGQHDGCVNDNLLFCYFILTFAMEQNKNLTH
jgi:hypothetical protein